jgi:anti-sigma B factor antagonist
MSAQLHLREHAGGRITRLVATGELDLATAPKLEAAVERLCSDPGPDLILDLSAVSLIDTAGVRAILACKRVFEENDCGFWVMSATAPARRVLQRYGVVAPLPFSEPPLAGP